jgi:hypothetical protein
VSPCATTVCAGNALLLQSKLLCVCVAGFAMLSNELGAQESYVLFVVHRSLRLRDVGCLVVSRATMRLPLRMIALMRARRALDAGIGITIR